jgi:hypothetical protein
MHKWDRRIFRKKSILPLFRNTADASGVITSWVIFDLPRAY